MQLRRKSYGRMGPQNVEYNLGKVLLSVSVNELCNFIYILKRLLYLCRYIYRELLADEIYYFDVSSIYYCPIVREYETYVAYTRKLPIITEPSVFGMNENADILKDQRETDLLFTSLLLTQVTFHLNNNDNYVSYSSIFFLISSNII